jgi:NADPH:quinone reductase-like Zn-dependent oxidoreductase
MIEKATVKAVVIHAPGAPEQLVIADMPEPGPGEVLVDAYAEKVVVAATMLMRLPDDIPFDVGAALTVQPLTGYPVLST